MKNVLRFTEDDIKQMDMQISKEPAPELGANGEPLNNQGAQ
jgi:hypothetical protein